MKNCYAGSGGVFPSNSATFLSNIVVCLLLSQGIASQSLRAAQRVAADDVTFVPPPRAGDLVGQAKVQLVSDHRTLGKVAASLMSVQTDVDKTERSMLGKVLDLQTAKSFFQRQGEIESANEMLQDDVSKLNVQVEGLSASVSTVQRAFLATAAKNLKSEGKLRAESILDKSLIQSISDELAKGSDVQDALRKLSKIHDNLMAEGAEVVRAGEKSVAMLKAERDASGKEVGKIKSLRSQLVLMNNYSVACHKSVEQTSGKLGKALLKDSKDSQAGIMTQNQRRKAGDAAEQRLLAERALLVSEVKRVEGEETEGVKRLRDLRQDLHRLQVNIVSEVREVELKIAQEKERLRNMRTALMENTQAMDNDLKAKQVTDAQIAEVSKKLHDTENPVIIATTEAQNDALKMELTQAFAMWKTVKEAETAAVLNVEQATTQVTTAKSGYHLANQALEETRKEGEKQFAEAVKKAKENTRKSMALIEKARGAIAGRCKTKWDTISTKKNARLKTCKRRKSELVMEKAKKESLMQTLKARVESS